MAPSAPEPMAPASSGSGLAAVYLGLPLTGYGDLSANKSMIQIFNDISTYTPNSSGLTQRSVAFDEQTRIFPDYCENNMFGSPLKAFFVPNKIYQNAGPNKAEFPYCVFVKDRQVIDAGYINEVQNSKDATVDKELIIGTLSTIAPKNIKLSNKDVQYNLYLFGVVPKEDPAQNYVNVALESSSYINPLEPYQLDKTSTSFPRVVYTAGKIEDLQRFAETDFKFSLKIDDSTKITIPALAPGYKGTAGVYGLFDRGVTYSAAGKFGLDQAAFRVRSLTKEQILTENDLLVKNIIEELGQEPKYSYKRSKIILLSTGEVLENKTAAQETITKLFKDNPTKPSKGLLRRVKTTTDTSGNISEVKDASGQPVYELVAPVLILFKTPTKASL